ncbi:hypothetical protein N2152v2_000281 [Parachlorella kessleri]
MNGFFHDLPPSLAAVAVSVVGDSTSLRLLDLAELFSQCGPIFHTLQAFEASSQHPSEFALVVFYDKAAAAAACELFRGYPISSTCSLEVQYAPRQALQRLAQMLVKCMQSADFGAELRSASPGHPAEPFPRPASSPAFPTHSNRILPADWQQQQQQPEQQQEPLPQPPVPPTSFPPSQLPRSGALASSSQHHRDLAAAAVAAWGAPPGASHGMHPQQQQQQPQQQQPAQGRVLDRVLEPSPATQLGRPLADPWEVTHPLAAARTADPPASGPWGRLPTATPPAGAGHQLPGEVQQQHMPQTQHHHQQQPGGPPVATSGAEGVPIPPMAELARLQLSASALRKQQEAFLAAAQQSQQRQGNHAIPAPHQQQQAGPAGYAAVAAAAMPPPPPPAATALAKGAWGAGAPTHIPQPTAASAEPPGSFARTLAGVSPLNIDHAPHQQHEPQQQAVPAQEGWEEVGRRSVTARRSSAGVSVASSTADQQEAGGSLGPADGLGRRLYIKNLRQDVKPPQLEAIFRRYGTIEECAKLPDATHAFVTFQNESQAAMAFAELNDETLPALCAGSTPLWIEFREAPAAAQGSPRKGTLAAGALGGKPATIVSSGAGASRTQPYAAVPSSAGTAAAAPQPQGQLAHHFPPQQRREEEASQPTTKLWVGGICGTAREETLKKIFGKFGSVYGIELRPAPEPGRRDQWAFVNFRNKADCMKARDELVDKVIPELTGNMRLKLRYKEPGTGPQDRKTRTGGR